LWWYDSDSETQASLPTQSGSNPTATTTSEGSENDDIEITQSVGLEGGLSEIDIDLSDKTASNDFGAMLDTEDLCQIQEDIMNTMRPTSQLWFAHSWET